MSISPFSNKNILFEDNHIMVVIKPYNVPTQKDATKDTTLIEWVQTFIKQRDNKPGNVFLGLVHRLDRPASGLMVLAKTSKALSRLNESLRQGLFKKEYLAWVTTPPTPSKASLEHYLRKNSTQNKSYCVSPDSHSAKKAILDYTTCWQADNYTLLKIEIHTGRHHQIRAQLGAISSPIKGDVKYGARRANPSRNIDLLAYRLQFPHPIHKQKVDLTCPLPHDPLWESVEPQTISSKHISLKKEAKDKITE